MRSYALAVFAAAVAAVAAIAGKGAFIAGVVARVAFVALTVPGLVAVEVVELFLAALRHRSAVTVVGIVAVINVAEEAVRAVEPGTGSEENSIGKPVWAVVAIGGAVIGGVVEVAVGAYRSWSDVNADGDLGGGAVGACEKGKCKNRESKCFEMGHNFSLIGLDGKVTGELSVGDSGVRRVSRAVRFSF